MRSKTKRNVDGNQADVIIKSSQTMNHLTFPYHILKPSNRQELSQKLTISTTTSHHKLQRWSPVAVLFNPLKLSCVFPKVYAEEKEKLKDAPSNEDEEQQIRYSRAIESLAHAYIQRENGWDRIKMMFEKDHRGKHDLELTYIQVALVQVFILTFFCKYVPVAKFARKEFIREHQATVFRTRFEAIRRLQDYTFIKAGSEAASFSTKITLFSASFLFLTSTISSYRNKSSVLEYTVAAGITGGLARMNLGIKGFVAGSVVGAVLGSAIGGIGYLSLRAYGITTEERHLEAIKDKLEVVKSIEGESSFRDRVNQILMEEKALAINTQTS